MSHYPSELTELPRWHCWVQRNGTKMPVQVDGFPAKANTPSTWSDFQTATIASANFSGLACVIQAPFTGVDLDNCLDDSGELRAWAIPIVARLAPVSYSEISPSGTGIKFITRARKETGARCVHKFGDDKQQLECYDHDRFWTMTGDVYGGFSVIGDGQSVIDWICGEYLETREAKTLETAIPFTGSSLETRASDYIDSCDIAGQGDRNNSAFRVAGHLWSLVDEHGQRLSEERIFDLTMAWNQRNLPPLPETEIRRVVASAIRNGTPRQDKPPQIFVPEPDGDVDLSGILNTKVTQTLHETFPRDILHDQGLIGDIIRYNLATAHYPLPELAVAGAIAMMSTVTGGKVEFQRSRSNLFVMGLAPSGGGKDHSRKINREILFRAGHQAVAGPERIGSHAGMISAISASWLTLFQIDEIGRLLVTMQDGRQAPHLYNIASVLLQVYGSADSIWTSDAYADRNKVKTLEYPHCVVYGTSVPDGFWEGLTKQNLSEGLVGRFLVFESPDYVDYQQPAQIELPESIVERARMWLDLKTHNGNLAGSTQFGGGSPRAVMCDEAAHDRLHSHAMQISEKRKTEDPVTAAIWSRTAEKTNKLALILACSRFDGQTWPTIGIDDVERAIKLNNWLTRRMLHKAGLHVSESHFEADQLKVLRVIRRKPEWTQKELTRATRWLRSRDRNEILATLRDSGEIDVTLRETEQAGPNVTIIRTRIVTKL